MFHNHFKKYLYVSAVVITFMPFSSFAAEFSDGDACTTAGLWHQKNNTNGVHYLICNGTTWEDILYIDKGESVAVGTISPSSGLKMDVEGSMGAINYCDEDGNNCFTAASFTAAGSTTSIETLSGATTPIFINDLDDVLDVNTSGVIDGECLKYNASTTGWESGECGTGGGAVTIESLSGAATPIFSNDLDDLLNVNTSGVADDECLVYDLATTSWGSGTCGTGGGGSTTIESLAGAATPTFTNDLGDLLDVNVSGVVDEECLQYDSGSTSWVTGTCGGGAGTTTVIESLTGAATPTFTNTLNDVADVTITTPSTNDVLTYNGSNWEAQTLSGLWTSGTGDDVYYNAPSAQVGIGITNPDVALDVEGDINYTGVIADVSDRRLKTDIANIPAGSLNKMGALRGVSFKMKDGDDRMETGFIAQDVQPLYPHLVQTDDKGLLSMNYIGLIAPMVEAMKELKAENDALRARIEIIEAKDNSNE